jgi:hypothetical protein
MTRASREGQGVVHRVLLISFGSFVLGISFATGITLKEFTKDRGNNPGFVNKGGHGQTNRRPSYFAGRSSIQSILVFEIFVRFCHNFLFSFVLSS